MTSNMFNLLDDLSEGSTVSTKKQEKKKDVKSVPQQEKKKEEKPKPEKTEKKPEKTERLKVKLKRQLKKLEKLINFKKMDLKKLKNPQEEEDH